MLMATPGEQAAPGSPCQVGSLLGRAAGLPLPSWLHDLFAAGPHTPCDGWVCNEEAAAGWRWAELVLAPGGIPAVIHL